METKNADYLVIGAGIAGLTLAYQLKKHGYTVKLIEKSGRIGGTFCSKEYKNSVYEWGPNTLMNNNESLNDLIRDLGLENELIQTQMRDSNRFLYLKEKLTKVPASAFEFIFSPLLSPWAKLRILFEPFIKNDKDYSEQSVQEFLSKKFGKEMTTNLVANFLQGIWGGDYKKLSADPVLKKLISLDKEHGSIIIGGVKAAFAKQKQGSAKKALSIISFKNGLSSLTDRLAEEIGLENILLNTDYKDLNLSESQLIIATKAFEAAEILEELGSSASLTETLKQIDYAPISLVAMSIDKSLFKKPLNGFGFLFGNEVHSKPSPNHLSLGTIFSSELFPRRELEDEHLLVSFLGGAKNQEIQNQSLSEITEEAIQEQIKVLNPLAQRKLSESDFHVVDTLKINKAIPQYNLGYKELIQSIHSETEKLSGIYLTGNYINGISVGDTISYSLDLAKQLAKSRTPELAL